MCTRILLTIAASACLALPMRAADTLLITEFMANNIGPLLDQDGEASDWLEIHNPGTNTVSLAGWYLTDNPPNVVKWGFPATNIAPNAYMIIWASEKDRRVPGRELHTNFRLATGGEYLGLIRPDLTVSSEYAPQFPAQVPRVSYGIPILQTTTTLLATGAAARVYVPTNDALTSTWVAEAFDDSAWLAAVTGVGYETDGQGPFTPALVANSVADFSGQQGSNNWYYGYWDRAADPNGAYSDLDMGFFPNANEAYGGNNFFDGTNWHWFAGDPPFTSISAQGATPNASNGVPARADHWAVRRWVSEVAGLVKITGQLNHTNSSDWVYVTQTGVALNSQMYVYLTAPGEGYLDDVKLVAGSVPEAGPNVLPNGDFESALTGPWTVESNHSGSAIVTSVKHGGNSSLHLVASVGGTTQASSIWQIINPALVTNNTYTLSYWFKPGTNNAPLVIRFSSNWINTSPPACGDGVTGKILVDGTEVFSQSAFLSSALFNVTVPVNFGSRVDFALDPRTSDFCDGAAFTAQIETADPGNLVVADSVADWSFSGTQGEKNWFYGYYNRTADAGGVYAATDFTPFPRSAGSFGAGNYWTSTVWDWPSGNPPWDEISQTGWHPNGINNAAEHWVIRRWVSEVSGRITVDWTVAKANLAGNGVTGRIMHNGVLMDSASIAGNNGAGVNRSITISNVSIGDFIDFSLDPNGPTGDTGDGSDGSLGTMVIRGTPTLTSSVASNIESAMRNVNSCAYVRIPFNVVDPAGLTFLTLRMKYDDGFAAYLNGVQVASRNALDFQNPLTWNSVATANRPDSDVVTWDEIDITSFAGLLHTGTNVLAIHGLNANAADSDFLILPELRAANVTLGLAGYFATPTPGSVNGATSTNIGPLIFEATHTPNVPLDNENLLVTAQVFPSFHAVSNVQMIYRIAFGSEVTTNMFDDGLHGDGAAGDGLYGATIPASVSSTGQMVRYYVSAQDIRTNRTRLPFFDNVVGSATYNALSAPQYFGTIVHLPQTNSLPLFHWFIQTPTAADNDTGTRCSIFYNGQFRDNVGVTLHGQSSAGFPKKSYNFNLNKGYKMSVRAGAPDVSDFAVMSTWADRTHVRNSINTETYTHNGVPAHYNYAIRVQQNEVFFNVSNLSEQGNEEYLERIGYDPEGALYKMYNTFTGAAGNEKKSRKYEGTTDLQDFYNALVQADVPARTTYIWDNVNLPNMINFLAAKAVGSDHDCCHKNYYYYRDSNVSGEWYALPWDFDLSYGHIWTGANGNYFDDTMYTNNFVGVGNNNTQFALMWADPVLKSMWTRRVRTLMDTYLQPPGTGTNADFLRSRLDYYANQVRADARLDKIKWNGPTWVGVLASHGGPANPLDPSPTNNFEVELSRIKNFYLPGRRTFLNLSTTLSSYGIPNAQPTNVTLLFGAVEYSPANANQAQEYIEIINTNTFAVDISGWKLQGGVDFTFAPGTTIGGTNKVYVTQNLKSFRARATGPRAGQRLLAVGTYGGQLSARGETLVLVDAAGQTNRSITYAGTPTLAQQYLRITEIMYHPAPPPTGPYLADDFEFIELKNIGPVPIPMTGVHFTNGIEFTFTATNVPTLDAGAAIVLVRNAAAFASRYPSVTNVGGTYLGALDNNGESIRLDDAVGEKILDFAYNNSWYRMTDGNGLSLVIVDENAAFNTWGDRASWRPSSEYSGSPGAPASAPLTFAPILVTEVLTHTDLPSVDAIEIHNPTTNDVDIGNWLISDDFITPNKYRIPAPRIIPAGGYLVFYEGDFNTGPTAFSFSSKADEAYLFSGDAAGNPNGYYHGHSFDGAQNGVTFGRYLNSMTNEHFVAQSSNTLGSANAVPFVGPLIISEILYHPPETVMGTNVLDNTDDEFIELQNITTNDVALYDPAFPTNRWKLTDAVEYTFSTNDVIAAGGFLVVVSFDPATNAAALAGFRGKYGLDNSVAIVGPYSGKLDNSEDKVELRRPDAPDAVSVPYILVERVHYLDLAPWDSIADGFGAALNRLVITDYGNEPTNWIAGSPSPGSARPTGPAPVVTQQPADATAFVAGSAVQSSVYLVGTTNFTASVSGDNLHYQWFYNGTNLLSGATNQVLTLTNLQFGHAGQYRYLAFNGGGSVFSSNATLTVIAPVNITTQPASQNVVPGTNFLLNVAAVGVGTLRYQWRFEGTNLPNATNSSYPIVGANLTNHHGNFSVEVSDDLSTALSANASIYVLVKPGIVQHITYQYTLAGGTAVFSVIATGAPPLGYRWLRNGSFYAATAVPQLVVTNTLVSAGFRLVVSNLAQPNGVFSPGPTPGINVSNIVYADADRDGLADLWETTYFGSVNTTNNPGNAFEDADGDGMINLDEYRAGTIPTDASSVLKLVLTATNATALTFVAQTNLSYSVQWRTDFQTAYWSNLTSLNASPLVRTILLDTLTAPPGGSERYFRVVTPKVP